MISTLRQQELLSRISRINLAEPQKLIKNANKTLNGKLRVAYVMTHVSVCGGVKVIFEHTNRLKELGWEVYIISHFPKPDWYPVFAEYLQVPFGIELAQGIPPCDVIVATYWDHIQACIETGIAPVVYFEQGDEHLFHIDRIPEKIRSFVEVQLGLPQFLMTVSNQASKLIKENFGREAIVIPNALDHTIFKIINTSSPKIPQYILMMGNESIEFKGIPKIVEAFNKVKGEYPELQLYWINPKEPGPGWGNAADRVFVNPTQTEIAELFRNAYCYISASEYETFSLPVLEAMATGCPVISTENSGVLEYGIHDFNLLLTRIGDLDDLVIKMMNLLDDVELRDKLILNGLQTAQQYDWVNVISKLKDFLQQVSEYDLVPSTDEWEIVIDIHAFSGESNYLKFKQALYHVPDDNIYLPVIYNWMEDHPILRWELAASRKIKKNGSSLKVLSPLVGNIDTLDSIYLGKGISFLLSKSYDLAVDFFTGAYSVSDESWKPSILKWLILCLIEQERDNEAVQLLSDAIRLYPQNTDLIYLNLQINLLNGYSDTANLISNIQVIGDAMDQNECFYNLSQKVEDYKN